MGGTAGETTSAGRRNEEFLYRKESHIHRENTSVLDIMLVATLYAFNAQEEVLAMKILDQKRVHSYIPG
ncbi:hypothetical protein RND71_010358 [Anisodus tanguticus]|uniref:Uncharacterized protein n=1 Tax=Anisodus tanguticus TaxID=243964 RepID=A0AAE1VI35_9SOLA|nr:hypothetical protein RND71_010358 [Anisodus tanguticus]